MRILLCSDQATEVQRMVTAQMPEYELIACAPTEVPQHLAGVNVLVPTMTRIPAALLEQGQFGLVQQFGVGLEGVDVEAATRLGVWVARIPSVGTGNAESVAEHALLLILALARRLPLARQYVEQRRLFEPRGQALLGKRACIIGMGGIGTALAPRLAALGMTLIATRARPELGAPPGSGIEHVYGAHELHTALRDCDVVVLCARYDQHNHHMINDAALAAMKPGAFLINVARGGLVDPDALLRALESGHLAGAGLDVYWEEPVDPQHPLFRHNVIATPHIAGVTDIFYAGVTGVFVENIRRYARGETPLYTVNTPETIRNAPRQSGDAAGEPSI